MTDETAKAGRWSWLTGTQLQVWHMIVAAIFTTLVTTGVPLYVDWRKDQTSLFKERSEELVNVSVDFENNVNRLVTSGDSFDAFRPEERLALMQNVEAQIRALNKITPILTGDAQRRLADDYAITLIAVRDMLQDGFSADETRAFGVAAQKLVLTRDEFLAGLS